MGLQNLIRFLLPSDGHWYDRLEELSTLSHEAAKVLLTFRERPGQDVQKEVQAIEHRADDVVRRSEDALARTFVTPLDREDIHQLTGALDDIIDLMNLAARAFSLYHLERPTPAMVALMEKLVEATGILSAEVPHLRAHRYVELLDGGRKVRVVEKEADTIYRAAISRLFEETHPDFRELLKQKESLDDLEAAVDHCDNVADLLSNLAVKHG